MKNILLVALFTASLMACNTDTAKQNTGTDTKANTPTAPEIKAEVKVDSLSTVTYVCPMDPEITSTKAGEKCSKCGMDLVLKNK